MASDKWIVKHYFKPVGLWLTTYHDTDELAVDRYIHLEEHRDVAGVKLFAPNDPEVPAWFYEEAGFDFDAHSEFVRREFEQAKAEEREIAL